MKRNCLEEGMLGNSGDTKLAVFMFFSPFYLPFSCTCASRSNWMTNDSVSSDGTNILNSSQTAPSILVFTYLLEIIHPKIPLHSLVFTRTTSKGTLIVSILFAQTWDLVENENLDS